MSLCILTPTEAPGRASRKARAYASEIARLQRAGYTIRTIQRALADAGCVVSPMTVWREASRAKLGQADPVPGPVVVNEASSANPAVQHTNEGVAPPAPNRPTSRLITGTAGHRPVADPRSSQQIAEDAMNSFTHPLVRKLLTL